MTYQNDHDFHFYSSENDGYRGGLGGYTDPTPGQSQPPHEDIEACPSGDEQPSFHTLPFPWPL